MRRLMLAVASLAVAASLASPPLSTAAPTITLDRDCSRYPTLHGINIRLSGFPPITPFAGTLEFPDGAIFGATFSTDSAGNFAAGPFGSELAGVFKVTVSWSGGTLTESLDVNCALPTSTAECKNGGWRNFGVFKNQGDCVSFVATKRKSLPAISP
jgi:hypothetical protein